MHWIDNVIKLARPKLYISIFVDANRRNLIQHPSWDALQQSSSRCASQADDCGPIFVICLSLIMNSRMEETQMMINSCLWLCGNAVFTRSQSICHSSASRRECIVGEGAEMEIDSLRVTLSQSPSCCRYRLKDDGWRCVVGWPVCPVRAKEAHLF